MKKIIICLWMTHLCCLAQMKEVNTFNYSSQGTGLKRVCFNIQTDVDSKTCILAYAERIKATTDLTLQQLDSNLSVIKSTKVSFEKMFLGPVIISHNASIYVVAFDILKGEGEVVKINKEKFSVDERFPFKTEEKKVSKCKFEVFCDKVYMAFEGSESMAVYTIEKNSIKRIDLSSHFKSFYDKFEWSKLITENGVSELIFVYSTSNHKAEYKIVSFTKDKVDPDVFSIPFIEERPVKNIELVRRGKSDYLVYGTLSNSENKIEDAFFIGELVNDKFEIFQKILFVDITDFNENYPFESVRKGYEKKLNAVLHAPVINDKSVYAFLELFVSQTSGAGQEIRQVVLGALFSFSLDSRNSSHLSFKMSPDPEHTTNRVLAGVYSDCYLTLQPDFRNDKIRLLSSEGSDIVITEYSGGVFSETKNIDLSSILKPNTRVRHLDEIIPWYGDYFLYYDNLASSFFPISQKEFCIKKYKLIR